MRLEALSMTGAALLMAACTVGPATSPPTRSASPAASAPRSARPDPTAAPSAVSVPSTAPSPAAASPGTIGRLRVPFFDRVMDVRIVGEPGILAAWRPATQRELEAIPWTSSGDTGIGLVGNRRLVLGWLGTPCDLVAILTVSATSLVIDPAPRQGCDAIGVGRGVVLTYLHPIDPSAVLVRLLPRVLLPEPS